jgi:hypothetical protein
MARILVWGAAAMDALAALAFAGVLLARSMAAAGNPPGFDDAARPGLELALGLPTALVAVLLSPPVIALRWQRAPPASRPIVGEVAGLALGALMYVFSGLVATMYAVTERRTDYARFVLVFLVVPNLLAVIPAWRSRPWARASRLR